MENKGNVLLSDNELIICNLWIYYTNYLPEFLLIMHNDILVERKKNTEYKDSYFITENGKNFFGYIILKV